MSIHARNRWVTSCPVLIKVLYCCKSQQCSQRCRLLPQSDWHSPFARLAPSSNLSRSVPSQPLFCHLGQNDLCTYGSGVKHEKCGLTSQLAVSGVYSYKSMSAINSNNCKQSTSVSFARTTFLRTAIVAMQPVAHVGKSLWMKLGAEVPASALKPPNPVADNPRHERQHLRQSIRSHQLR